MGLPETVDFARNFSVMIRVCGPDPKGMKMRTHAFHQYNSGKTTLSASGMLLPDTLYESEVAKRLYGDDCNCLAVVVTVASIVEPFLSMQHRENIHQAGRPELISDVQIDVMVENSDKGGPCWLAAKILSLADISVSALSLQSLIEASLGSLEHGWEVGWSLASSNNGSQPLPDATGTQGHLAVGKSGSVSLMCKSTTRIAILGVSLPSKDVPDIAVLSMKKRGDFLLAVGSPFGVLSPVHFFNSILVGSIANCYPPSTSDMSLLMADIRSLPGMEGCPIFGEHGELIGLLIRPLKQKSSGVEIQLVIPWEAIATASSDLLLKAPKNTENGTHHKKRTSIAAGKASTANSHNFDGPSSSKHKHSSSHCSFMSPIEKAMASICLITTDDGVWASGVLLNNQGLILTNAHLLEPWRFGKTHVPGVRYAVQSEEVSLLSERSAPFECDGVERNQKSQILLPKASALDPFLADSGYNLSSIYKHGRNVRVRLDHVDPWIWCDAKVVYVCKGPWDVALLQLESVPDQLSPVTMNFAWPSIGLAAYVIGHGLFGPKCGFFPSVSCGVVAKVVKAKIPQSYLSIQHENTERHFPAMLETTAAIHPGGSGGAVVNSEGHMIGLVTSNARHGGGTIIPHLNFSIPSAALAPILKYSKDMQDLSLLQPLDQPDQHLSSVWALVPPLSPKPPPLPNLPQSLLDNDNKEVKGSRFAKFIAERKEIFKRPSQLGKVGTVSNEVIPSKL
ncbi:glyoxysomal processing protease, glyoxysomal [Quillaja saponaria]|uniref:Glyoxysomal processing protease, glyoxysomal n=1 Tax=Quillaja saponaria TaxID=32244 RepID=A0AAD7M249_QUISA|nr:glyoxysomal processing protease, glyoxysomal [Quillaja saponaria]